MLLSVRSMMSNKNLKLTIRLIIVLIACLIGPGSQYGMTQDIQNPLQEEIPEFQSGYEDFGMLRFKANHFFHKMVQVTEPGVASFQLDFNRNSSDKKSYVLNSDINLPVGLGGYNWRIGNCFINTLQVIPQVRIRILRDDEALGDRSLPVRTPSYLPRILWNFTTSKLWNYHDLKWSYYGALSAFHHSNGQDGNEFNPDGTINTYNGNFSQNVAFEARIGFTKAYLLKVRSKPTKEEVNIFDKEYYNLDSIGNRKIEKAVNKNKLINIADAYINEINHRIAFEWHPAGLSTLELEKLNLYGRHRINYLFNFRKIKRFQSYFFTKDHATENTIGERRWEESYRISVRASLITTANLQTGNINDLRRARFEERINLHLTVYRMIKGTDNAALFLRGTYMGSDEYNIYFQDQVWLLRFGLAFGYFNHG
ncbi:MAG: hypothetical protein AAFQ94_02645 [Bacteroidota bacterium]